MLHHLETLHWTAAALLFLAENTAVMLLALLLGYALQRIFNRPAAQLSPRQPITPVEWRVAAGTVLINSIITFVGFQLWRMGVITIRTDFSVRILADFVVLFLAMDFLMYVFHYLVHRTFLYRLIHRLHHQYREPQPIDLFVLHPLETVAFGSLWLSLMIFYPANLYAIIIYLSLNVAFGVLGHTGIEPFPGSWQKKPLLKYLGSSTFHFQHHQHEGYNFGFYTSLWDRLFGTLHP